MHDLRRVGVSISSLSLLFLVLMVTFNRAASAQTEKVLAAYKTGTIIGPLVFDNAGQLYGTAVLGRNHIQRGRVFRAGPKKGVWKEKTLYSFPGGNGGGWPSGGIIFDQAGNAYGTAAAGGQYGDGLVFELTPGAKPSQKWAVTSLHVFSGGGAGGPAGNGMLFDSKGDLFGVSGFNPGNVFELTPQQGGGWSYSTFQIFGGSNGSNPTGRLISDSAGNLYGITASGGAGNGGTAYELSYNPQAGWSVQLLYAFCSLPACADGQMPDGGLTLDPAGNLYGVTQTGGANNSGAVFELSKVNGTWTENVLYSFCQESLCADGNRPTGQLALDNNGNLFGTTVIGATTNGGTTYELMPGPSGWTYRLLYSFCSQPNCTDGINPESILLGSDGNLYGVADERFIFEITP